VPAQAPFFSVILPTRNRPALFCRALQSVLAQTFQNFEVLVVNDGSDDDCLHQYRKLESESDPRCRWHYQPRRPNGHGPSYSINTGAQMARGQYLCILDDDDSWEAKDHLHKAHASITQTHGVVDAYYSNQRAFTADGKSVEKSLWLNALATKLPRPGVTQVVDVDFLLLSGGFPHLNCSIIRRELYHDIGGMDEGIRYECETDLYLRTLDAAKLILYRPDMIARHNVPESTRKDNVSTAVNTVGKRLSQLTVYQKNLASATCEAVRERCRNKLAMVYKDLAAGFASERDYVRAALYARLSLALRYTVKWRLYCLQLEFFAALRG